jgi:hypothetical protein
MRDRLVSYWDGPLGAPHEREANHFPVTVSFSTLREFLVHVDHR